MTAARNGLGKASRLLKPADFRHVFKNGRKRYADNTAVYWLPNSLPYPRLGIAISRKCTRSAVIRNRIKRVVRESFRIRKQDLGGLDIVVLAQAGLAKIDTGEMRAIVEHHLTELQRCERS